MIECNVPVGWTCKVEAAMSGEQNLTVVLGLFGTIVLSVLIICLFIYLDQRGKRK